MEVTIFDLGRTYKPAAVVLLDRAPLKGFTKRGAFFSPFPGFSFLRPKSPGHSQTQSRTNVLIHDRRRPKLNKDASEDPENRRFRVETMFCLFSQARSKRSEGMSWIKLKVVIYKELLVKFRGCRLLVWKI
ncbi:uncharacterized protein LOC120015105 [Tripterygium wilfordii]|uniref:uncharacterized protein LOC120015105 n=1 Tax=Tripterygium wilfordii TaxID=458696 RepID=UPI0018F7E871|nr:uncharacterized protein LOC120015105 [Tripterygium wilfordii]